MGGVWILSGTTQCQGIKVLVKKSKQFNIGKASFILYKCVLFHKRSILLQCSDVHWNPSPTDPSGNCRFGSYFLLKSFTFDISFCLKFKKKWPFEVGMNIFWNHVHLPGDNGYILHVNIAIKSPLLADSYLTEKKKNTTVWLNIFG